MPCEILTLAVTARYKVLFSANRIMSLPLLSKHLPIQLRNVCLCLLPSLFPSTFSVTTRYSMPLFLSTCPKNLPYLFTICFINCLSVLALLNTFSFVTFFFQEIFRILRRNQTTFLPPRVAFCLASLIVHVSHPYIIVIHM